MKNIVLSLVTILLLGSTAVGATNAYFTDNTSISGLTFSTGTLEISDESESWMLPVTFTNLKPGDRIRKWVVLKNTGSLDVDYLKVTAINKSVDNSLLSQIIVSTTGRIGSNDPAYFTDDWGSPPSVNSWFTNSDLLDLAFYRTPAGVIKPGENYTVTFDFVVPTTLGDAFQGKTASFDIRFDAEQVH